MLRHSGRRRDRAGSERRAALARVEALQGELNRLREAEERLLAPRFRAGRMHAHELQQTGARRSWFEQQCAQVMQKLHDAMRELQERERTLTAAHLECRKFEVLRDRRHRGWSLTQERIAQKQIDEFATQGHFRTPYGA